MAKKKQPQRRNKQANLLRIIGGDWRSRKLKFVDAPGLRPTPDRIRETLFNWLQGKVHGARCLDLFAGSGALGLEALSRGAREVDFVEMNQAVANQLTANLNILKTTAHQATVHQNNALEFLEKLLTPYDIIFLDPPYRRNLLETSLELIKQKKLLRENSIIYLEHEEEKEFDWQLLGFDILKQAKAGQVQSLLLQEHITIQSTTS